MAQDYPQFLPQLRMNGIFGPGGNMGQPDMNSSNVGNPMDSAIAALQLRSAARNDDMNRQVRAGYNQQMFNNPMAHRPAWEAGQNASQNLKPDGSPMDTRVLYPDEETTQEKTAKEIAHINNQGRLNVAGQNNSTRSTIANANLNEKAREADLKDTNTDQDRVIKQQRANTYDFKTRHPNAQVLASKGGNFMLYDPASGQVHDSGVSTGTMSQADFQEQLQSGRETIAGMNADSAANVQNMRNQGALADISARTAGQQQVQASKNSTTKPLMPSQQRIDFSNRARQLRNSRPDLAPYINFDSQGNPVISAGSDTAAGTMINDELYNSRRGDINLPGVTQSSFGDNAPASPPSRYQRTIK